MKKLTLLFGIPCLFIVSNTEGQIYMNSSGNVGIGNLASSTYVFQINSYKKSIILSSMSSVLIDPAGGYYGPSIAPNSNQTCDLGDPSYYWNNLYVKYVNGSLYTGSDSRFKENIKPLANALDLVTQLDGVSFDVKKEFAYNDEYITEQAEIDKLEQERKNKYGFIAQDLQSIVPGAVRIEDSTGYLSVEYTQLIPILTEAIKEQQALIVSLQADIESLYYEMASVKKGSALYTDIHQENNQRTTMLYQNIPNPFSHNTEIEYFIEKMDNEASIIIYDMQGLQKKVYKIYSQGKGSINIYGKELKPGMYLYTLLVDGMEVETKKMILTE